MKNLLEIDLQNSEIYQEKVWGDTQVIAGIVGRDPKDFGDKVIGEVFITSTHPAGLSKLTDGRYVKDAMQEDATIFGSAVTPKGDFPILLKALSATEPLSVQTHYKNKIEAWYTLSEGEMLYGLTKLGEKTIQTQEGRDKLTNLLHSATAVSELAPFFNHVTFGPNESYIIHAGMVHALLRGTVLEPQKNSNLTMRGGDWGRNDPNRELHINDFFLSMYPFAIEPKPIPFHYKAERAGKEDTPGSKHKCLFATQDFALDEIVLERSSRMIETFDDRFFIVTMLEGEMTISDGTDKEELHKDRVFILKAQQQEWLFEGTGRVLLTYVPNIMKGIVEPLRDKGNTYDEIVEIGGPVLQGNDIYIELKEKGVM